jgi:serine/threonine protein kinase
LGKTGSFGRVRLSRNKLSNKYYALKILKKAEIIRLKQVDHVISENSILAALSHPFIVNMDGFTQDERYLYLVLEFVSGGEVFTYLRSVGRLEPPHSMFYIAQVTAIFDYLHSKNIIYR